MACDLRLQGLEKKILIEAGETPAVVYEMKKQVDSFREKLEVLCGFKALHGSAWHNNNNKILEHISSFCSKNVTYCSFNDLQFVRSGLNESRD